MPWKKQWRPTINIITGSCIKKCTHHFGTCVCTALCIYKKGCHACSRCSARLSTGATMISEDLRKCIVAWHFEQQKGAREISKLAGCSKRAVYNILALYREYGLITNPYACCRGCPCVLDMTVLNYMSSLLDSNPALYLDEIQEKLLEVHDIEVHISTISRSLRRLAISHKDIAKAALERNEHLRATWQGVNVEKNLQYPFEY